MKWLKKILSKVFLNTSFKERRGIITIDVHISGDKSESNPDLSKDGIRAEAMPVNGKIWVKGYMTDKGVKPFNYAELGHEVMHILAHQCEGFADPDAKETFVGTAFNKDR